MLSIRSCFVIAGLYTLINTIVVSERCSDVNVRCTAQQYCIDDADNNKYVCADCNSACDGCVGPNDDNCLSCALGFILTGRLCKECPSNTFGVNCTGSCHCLTVAQCGRSTGYCSEWKCKRGWKEPPYCQDPCDNHTFGLDCADTCHCPDGDGCNTVNGLCNSGLCHPDYGGASCQVHLPKLKSPPSIVSAICAEVRLSWKAWEINVDIGIGPIAQYGVFKLQNGTSNWSRVNVVNNVVNRTVYYQDVKHLQRDGDYKFRVDTHRLADEKVSDASLGFITDWVYIPCTVSSTDLPITTTTERSVIGLKVFASAEPVILGNGDIRFVWSMTPNVTGIELNITLYYQNVSVGDCDINNPGEVTLIRVTQETRSIVISNLEPWRIYAITIEADGVRLNISDRVVRKVATQEIAPSGYVTGMSTKDVTSNRSTVTWSPPPCEQRGGILVRYDVVLDDLTHATATKVVVVNVTSVTFDNLIPFSSYSVKIRYVNMIGTGNFSQKFIFRTLQSVPSAVTIVSASALETAINITFMKPEPVNGILIDYSVTYSTTSDFDLPTTLTFGVSKSSPASHRSVQILNLKSFILYYIKIRASTEAGYGVYGPIMNITTLQDFPTPPKSVSKGFVNETCLSVVWERPANSNGLLVSYQILYREASVSESSSIQDEVSDTVNSYTKCLLKPGKLYTFSVAARNARGYGPVTVFNVWTEHGTPRSPDPPIYINSTYTTIAVTIKPVILTTGPLSAYVIQVEKVKGSRKKRVAEIPGYVAAELSQNDVMEETVFTVGDGNVYGGILNAPLENRTKYNIYYVVNSTLNGITKLSYVKMLEPIVTVPGPILTTPKPEVKTTTTPTPVPASDIGMIVGIVLGILLLILVILLLILLFCWYKRRNRKSIYHPYAIKNNFDLPLMKDDYDPEKYWNKIFSTRESRFIVAGRKYLPDTPATIDDSQCITSVNPPVTFVSEFKNIPHKTTSSCHEAKKRHNQPLNRFPYLLPYDKNRVILKPDADSDNDYINASHIIGYNHYHYIAATSPFDEHTVLDFWRMIYQNNIKTIVMITNVVEDNIIKCTQYWPDGGKVTWGGFMLELVEIDSYADYIIRTIEVTGADAKKTITTKLFEYTSWPDHGVPSDSIPLLEMRYKVRQYHADEKGPMVVHCGTGVARTGTYIALDSLIEQYAQEGRISVFVFVRKLRKERSFMVRTHKQYIFIYEAIFEEFHAGDTTVGFDLRDRYHELTVRNEKTGHSFLKGQFRLLENYTRSLHPTLCHTALLAINYNKNRYADVIPHDEHRPMLVTPGGVGRTDYINATFVDSYRKKDAFILTQTPLHTTIIDFWKMVYDFNVSTIVMVENFTREDDTCAEYWPDVNMKPFEPFFIETTATYQQDNVTIRNFKIFNSQKPKDPARFIRQFQFNAWAEPNFVPVSKTMILDLLDLVNDWQEVSNQNRNPVVVHCKDGATHSGLFCALSVICEKMCVDDEVDVYHTVKHIKRRRTQVLAHMEQYRFCYKTLWDYMNLRMQSGTYSGSLDGKKHDKHQPLDSLNLTSFYDSI